MAEYNALLIGLQLTHEMGVPYLEAYGDSKLIINQVKGEYVSSKGLVHNKPRPQHTPPRQLRGLQNFVSWKTMKQDNFLETDRFHMCSSYL